MFSAKSWNAFVQTFKGPKRTWLILPYALLLLVLFIIPLIIVLVNAFTPFSVEIEDGSSINVTIADNFSIIDSFTITKIFKSFGLAVACTIICLLIAFPFAYLLSISKNKLFKYSVVALVTAPIWNSFLIKVIGLKSLLDLMFGEANSTFGDGWTLLGLVYIFMPFMILPIYTVLISMPKNYMLASQDLGYNYFMSFFKVVIPYCKNAIISGVTLVLLPSFTTAGISQFVNNSNDGQQIGAYLLSLGSNGLESKVAISQASALSLTLALIILAFYMVVFVAPKLFNYMKKRAVLRNKIKTVVDQNEQV
ncbi:ABC transporter permease [Mycoplasma bradburyae]|uniref:ABC transporter permease n=1 Tax=Mycoplasma bradburyae TaxID=2963128 RepID=A0AAW6HRP5_9MOLU|nr:ABC transporter permease [Mycoplasma bradburyae]MDC4183521.1 ABC transporter permease [Mycoplasma bradburyae]